MNTNPATAATAATAATTVDAPVPPPVPVCVPLGRNMVTRGVMDTFANLYGPADALQKIIGLLRRHRSGDWGDLDDHDRTANDHAYLSGDRLLSAYNLADHEPETHSPIRIWIITEWDRSMTTVLLPDEY